MITSEAIASLVGDTWPQSVTPINILSGFKKSGISPLNPSEVSDRMLAPAKGLKSNNSKSPPTYSAELCMKRDLLKVMICVILGMSSG